MRRRRPASCRSEAVSRALRAPRAGIRSAVSAAAALWDGRRDGKEVQENASTFVGAAGELPPVAAWVVPAAREGRANKRTKRQNSLAATFGLDITNTRQQMLDAGAGAA